MKKYLSWIAVCGIFTSFNSGERNDRLTLKQDAGRDRVEVRFNGELFTEYRFEKTLEKPVLYPVIAPGGVTVTRGFPIEPREKERVDHPHQVGLWFSYGDVNGFDFWNNSFAISPESKARYGRINYRGIVRQEVKDHRGILEVKMDWVAPDTDSAQTLLEEHTTFVFEGNGEVRSIDRTTRLTAIAEEVVFRDNKEGMLAIRVDRAFEQPSTESLVFTDASGNPSDVPVLDNEGVTGRYRNSNGIEGEDAWGKNAEWVKLGGIKDGQPFSIVIFDHPGNVNYPACWHARGYGLFSVNNLGRNVYNGELDPFELVLRKGESVEFKHRIVVAAADLTDQEITAIADDFKAK
jgi:hypothetical protein